MEKLSRNLDNEHKKIDLKQIDNVSKIALIILIAIVGYFLIFLIISSLLTPKQTPMMQMMSEMIGTNMMSFSTTNSIIINLISLVFGVGLGFLASLYVFRAKTEDKEYNILRKALSDDEKKIL
ncbi:MAG: hypothetical protein AABX90_03570, partial [Nanoarchaeota archaeon]